MQIQLIRNATLRIMYHDQLLLIDPFLADKHSMRPFAGVSPNPLVDLPIPAAEVIAGVQMVLISHLHTDHFDPAAQALLPKEIPLFCQPGDEVQIGDKGFQKATPIDETVTWRGITIGRTAGQHGTGELAQRMGQVSGFVLQAADEPTVYWAGDTIWVAAVAAVIAETRPNIIITHSSGAKFGDSDPIVMDAAQTIAVCRAAPQSKVVAVHLESLDHGTVTRAELRAETEAAGITAEQLLIPLDGEILTF